VALSAEAAPDSFNALPALLSRPDATAVRDHLVFHNGGTNGPFGLRLGQWKFIRPAGRAGQTNQLQAGPPAGQLYNLAQDPGETTNLAAPHPEKLKEMRALLARLRQEGRSRP
jgi:arylsulfatase A-like enzyme